MASRERKKEPGIEDIFLTFANTKFSGKPSQILKVIEEAEKYFLIDPDIKGYVCEIIYHMERFEKKDDKSFNHIISTLHDERLDFDRIDDSADMVAVYSVYGYLQDGCGVCPSRIWYPSEIEKYCQAGQPKCYECSQIQFNHLLDEIITKGGFYPKRSGKAQKFSYGSKIVTFGPAVEVHSHSRVTNKFIEFSRDAYKFYNKSIAFSQRTDKGDLKTEFYPFLAWKIGDNKIFRINEIIYSLAGISLCEYLFENDIKKIKRCPYCRKLFIALNVQRSTRCYSNECEKKYQRNKKRIQREREPDIYY
jgi:hypothetical protein